MKTTSTQYHDEIAAAYDKGYQSPYWRMYNEITWNYIKDYLPENKKNSLILDAGGGTGLWAIKLAKLGYNVTLTDISDGMLEVAEKNIASEGMSGKIRIIKADITEMKQFQNNMFDLILAEGDPVSYCTSTENAIGELSRVCRKNGYITVSVDSKLNWVRKSLNRCDFAAADRIMETGIAMMRVTENTEYPSFTFTLEELENIFRKNNICPIKTVGKPVFAEKQDLNDKSIYNKILGYELKYSSLRWLAAVGGHIAVIGQKKI